MQNEIEINLRDLAVYIRKRWRILITVTLVAMLIGFGGTKLFTTPIYESQSMIYITAGSDNVVQNMLSSLQAGNALTADYKTLATSKPVLEQVIAELNLDLTYDELKEKVSTENPDNTRILTIKVKDSDPKKAKEIVDKLTEIERDKIADVMGQTKPSILQKGDIQTKPVSASASTAGICMGLLAIFLMLLIFLAGYISSDSIVSSEDIEQSLELSTLAEVPMFENTEKKTSQRFRRHK